MADYSEDKASLLVAVPAAYSLEALEDPTHCRQFVPSSFYYFGQPAYWNADYDYTADWQVEDILAVLDREVAAFHGLEGNFADIPLKQLITAPGLITEYRVSMFLNKDSPRPRERTAMEKLNIRVLYGDYSDQAPQDEAAA
jgi:hypothetical protein